MTQTRREPTWWGQRQAGKIGPVSLADAAGAWEVPAFVATGTRPGPMLAVLACVHGDEYVGSVAVAGLLAELSPAEMAGTLIAVAVANPPAFAAGTRTSPLDGVNLARCFPGREDGTASERLAWLLAEEIIIPADALIDLHSGGSSGDMAPLIGYCLTDDEAGRRSRELALTFGAPILWEHPGIPTPGRTLSVASAYGIPSIYTESIDGVAAPPSTVRWYVEGVQRVLTALGMLPGPAPVPRHREFWRGAGDTDRALATPVSGLFRSFVNVGEAVTAAQPLGEIVDYDGHVLAQIAAPEDGVVAMARRLPRVAAGDGLYLLTQRVTG
jgi:predicted deacylase